MQPYYRRLKRRYPHELPLDYEIHRLCHGMKFGLIERVRDDYLQYILARRHLAAQRDMALSSEIISIGGDVQETLRIHYLTSVVK